MEHDDARRQSGEVWIIDFGMKQQNPKQTTGENMTLSARAPRPKLATMRRATNSIWTPKIRSDAAAKLFGLQTGNETLTRTGEDPTSSPLKSSKTSSSPP